MDLWEVVQLVADPIKGGQHWSLGHKKEILYYVHAMYLNQFSGAAPIQKLVELLFFSRFQPFFVLFDYFLGKFIIHF